MLNHIFSGVTKGPTTNKSLRFFPRMLWVRKAGKETNLDSSIQF
jgi:hypothetical protein